MDENLRNFFVSGISAPSRDVMLVKYTSMNELMVVKGNVKIVSTMLNEVRSIFGRHFRARKLSTQPKITTKTWVNIN